MDYASVAEIKNDMPDSPLFNSTDTTYNLVLGSMVTAASRMIDRYVGGWANYFYPTTDDQTRYFDGSGDDIQYIDPAVSITSVSVDETDSGTFTAWTYATDYKYFPINYSVIGEPIKGLKLVSSSNKSFYPYYGNVKIVGVFGYSATPPQDIKQACKIQAVRWFQRAKQGYQDASANAAIGEMLYMKELDPDVKMLLRPYVVGNV